MVGKQARSDRLRPVLCAERPAYTSSSRQCFSFLNDRFFRTVFIMPIYAYKCTNCGFEHDYLQKMSDKPLTQCPECGKDTLVKELSAPGFELKGSGWAATDFNGGHKALPASHAKSKK